MKANDTMVINADLIEKLDFLEGSELASEEYHLNSMNLCNAIITTSGVVSSYVDLIEDEAKRINSNPTGWRFDKIRDLTYQINTLASILSDRVSDSGHFNLCDIIYHYKELKNNK